MPRCAICTDNRGTFVRGKFGDPDSDWLCPACKRQNAAMGLTWGKASTRECHTDRLDATDFQTRLADCIADGAGALALDDRQRAIVRLLAAGERTVTRRVRRRVNGRRVYVAVQMSKPLTLRAVAAEVGCTISYVAKFARLLRGEK